jgi:hypothetical protein
MENILVFKQMRILTIVATHTKIAPHSSDSPLSFKYSTHTQEKSSQQDFRVGNSYSFEFKHQPHRGNSSFIAVDCRVLDINHAVSGFCAPGAC